MTRGIQAALLSASLGAALPLHAAEPGNVYALCTVRDVTVADNQRIGTIYRSAIFSAPASYDGDISMTPERGGKTSLAFESWIRTTRGFRPDRKSLSKGDEHYCIEAPLTLEGKAQLERMRTDWDRAMFARVEMVATDWAPPRRDFDRRFDAALQEYEQKLQATRAAEERYKRDLDAVEATRRRNAEAAQAAREQFARERAAYEAALAETERQRQAYREEYKRQFGKYPEQ